MNSTSSQAWYARGARLGSYPPTTMRVAGRSARISRAIEKAVAR
jgi:hypothetical protein